MFPAALLADIAYLQSAEIQWSNFSAWLITGELLSGAPALLWSVLRGLVARAFLSPLLFAAAWTLGLINAFQHSRDGWSSVGTAGLLLSILSGAAMLAAYWHAYALKGKAA